MLKSACLLSVRYSSNDLNTGLNRPVFRWLSQPLSHVTSQTTVRNLCHSYQLSPCNHANPKIFEIRENSCKLAGTVEQTGGYKSPRLSWFTLNISKQTIRDLEDWMVSIYILTVLNVSLAKGCEGKHLSANNLQLNCSCKK